MIGGGVGPLRPIQSASDTNGFRLVTRRQVGEHGACQACLVTASSPDNRHYGG
jgi:hypothetical protein